MLLARKLMPEDRRGTLSPMVNAPLAQAVVLQPDIPVLLAGWLPRLRQQFSDEMADRDADPSLAAHLDGMADDGERHRLISQYFLPFQAHQGIGTGAITAEAIAAAFDDSPAIPTLVPDMGPLYPSLPQDGAIRLPLPFLGTIFDQVLIGRHSHLYLETRRQGGTDAAASDAVIHLFMDLLAATDEALTRPPFRSRKLGHRDFARSFAYTQMMELGFSRDEMMAALAPWDLVD